MDALTLDEYAGEDCVGDNLSGFPHQLRCSDESCLLRAGLVSHPDAVPSIQHWVDRPFWAHDARVAHSAPRALTRADYNRISALDEEARPDARKRVREGEEVITPWGMHPLHSGRDARYVLLRVLHETPDWELDEYPEVWASKSHPWLATQHAYGLFPRTPAARTTRVTRLTDVRWQGVQAKHTKWAQRQFQLAARCGNDANRMAIASRRYISRVNAWWAFDAEETEARAGMMRRMLRMDATHHRLQARHNPMHWSRIAPTFCPLRDACGFADAWSDADVNAMAKSPITPELLTKCGISVPVDPWSTWR